MCSVRNNCKAPNMFWVRTNLPLSIATIREGENGITPDRSISTCSRHLAIAVKELTAMATDALKRHVNTPRGPWGGVTVSKLPD